jgi:hypothetical protein
MQQHLGGLFEADQYTMLAFYAIYCSNKIFATVLPNSRKSCVGIDNFENKKILQQSFGGDSGAVSAAKSYMRVKVKLYS